MRMLIDVKFPIEPFNTLIRNGTAGQKIQQILADLKPEVAYFSERDGKRGGIFIVDMTDASQAPVIAEPFFLTFDATVEFHIAISPEDLGAANLDALGEKWG